MRPSTMRLRRNLRAPIASLVLALAGLAFSASAAQALPAGFWGVVPQAVPSLEQLQRLRRGGVESVRVPINWNVVQPTRGGVFSWDGTDTEVEEAADAGIRVFPFLSGVPAWAGVPSVFVPGSGRTVRAAAHLPVGGAARSGWVAFVQAAIGRYGPNGSFWAEHPTVPKLPVRTWQIWNEENFEYFVARPNPAEYGKLVGISYAAVKALDPGAQVILGGMFARPKGGRSKAKPKRNYFAADFLRQMYSTTPGVKAKFNGVALHPYSYHYQELPGEIEELRGVMAKSHDGGKGLWITELGWSSQPPTRADLFAKGVGGQAAQLRGAFSLFKRFQVKWRLKGVYWFSVDDFGGACNFCDGSGLFGAGFKPKKSWFEYVRFAGGTP